jgi:hypothetical protein
LFDIVHDHNLDPHDFCRQIRMIDHAGRVDSHVIPGQENIQEVRDLWRKLLDCPDKVWVNCNGHNSQEYYWGFGYGSAAPLVPCALRSHTGRLNAMIYDGSDPFKADQMSRMLDVKVAPFVKGNVTLRPGGGVIIEFDCEWIPLGLRILREHELIWNVEGTLQGSKGSQGCHQKVQPLAGSL